MEQVTKKTNQVNKGDLPGRLKRQIGLIEAITIVVGIVIGSGIFFKSSAVFKNAGTPILGIMAWVVGGVITLASALTVAEVATAIPETGGVFVYLKELYGERWAFLFGWMQTIIYVPATAGALSIVFVTQATYFIPTMTVVQQKVLAIFIVFFVIGANILSTKLGSRIQVLATFCKLVPILIIIVFGLLSGTAHDFSTSVQSIPVNASGFGGAVLATLWAYDGWINVGNMAGELKEPKRDLPVSIILGLVITIVVYILINISIINIMPLSKVMASFKPTSDAAVILFGNSGAGLIAAGVMISIFGGLNGYLMTGVRVPFAMARDNRFIFPNFFGKISEKFKTPVNALILEGMLASLYIFSGSFDTLTNLAVFVMWIFFVMCVTGIFVLRNRHGDMKRPYKVPLYPFVPLIGIVGGVYILISTLITDTSNALYGIIITLIGLPIYTYICRKNDYI